MEDRELLAYGLLAVTLLVVVAATIRWQRRAALIRLRRRGLGKDRGL